MSRITDLTQLSALADGDWGVVVDVSDTTQAATGTTKKIAALDFKTYVKTGPVIANGQPANPAGTVSATLVMMGVGGTCKITPGSGGKVQVMITGQVAVATTANVVVTWGARFGTGTAPVNGAAVTGTRWGAAADYTTQTATAGVKVPFCLVDLLTLTPATAYWFDIAIGVASANSGTVTSLSFVAEEIS